MQASQAARAACAGVPSGAAATLCDYLPASARVASWKLPADHCFVRWRTTRPSHHSRLVQACCAQARAMRCSQPAVLPNFCLPSPLDIFAKPPADCMPCAISAYLSVLCKEGRLLPALPLAPVEWRRASSPASNPPHTPAPPIYQSPTLAIAPLLSLLPPPCHPAPHLPTPTLIPSAPSPWFCCALGSRTAHSPAPTALSTSPQISPR